MSSKYFFISLFISIFLLNSCKKEHKEISNISQFVKLDKSISKLDYNNILIENDSLNYFNYHYIYMGGGVAVADFNNDNLDDIYFTGMYNNKLYLNQGNLTFKDITTKNTQVHDVWSTGVTTVDINNDGLMDIYITVSGKNSSYKNKLLINQGIAENGNPSFIDEAEKYGIADDGHGGQSVFFDADNDGDLDLYVANYPITSFTVPNFFYQQEMKHPKMERSSHFYTNNGNNTFTNTTEKAGLLSFGLSIGVSVSDLNNDGYKDIYVSNDFASPDFIYFNNSDGTFTDQSLEVTQQTSFFGMGIDVADFNNDGLQDIIQLDMAPPTHKRSKENMTGMAPETFKEMTNMGMNHQYMANSLQLNRGFQENGLPIFSNIAPLAGVKSTDWSWGTLFADFNNDGFKDIFVTNGIRRDINNNDFFNRFKKSNYFSQASKKEKNITLIKQIPSKAIPNYLFENKQHLKFKNVAKEWGLGDESFSNGVAYADFDNDGDLDLVINNLDQDASLYENKANEKSNSNFLKINFIGTGKNRLGIGNKVHIYTKGQQQVAELMLTRGYQSSVPPTLHFGLGNVKKIDSLKVLWNDGTTEILKNIKTNKTLTLSYTNSKKNTIAKNKTPQLFKDITASTNINFTHKENNYDDYFKEPLLPHKMSQFGPNICVGDVNGDQLDDFWIGGALNQSGEIFIQDSKGLFHKSNSKTLMDDKNQEDISGLFFDADKDGDLDLYVVSGGNEFKENSKKYQDRLYKNDGKGNFSKTQNTLPNLFDSGSKVIPFDFDNDGDLDLFVASRQIPKRYPTPASSRLLENISTKKQLKFKDVSANSTTLKDIGMITDAIAIDFDNDNDQDLIVVGEWMPITYLENEQNTFKNVTEKKYLNNTTGWWFSIEKTDFDQDGDQDFIVGNLGLNYKYKANPNKTFDVYANDFDNNKSLDIVLGYYEGKTQYPVRGRQCSSQQIPEIKNKFKDYEGFADANLKDIYTIKKLKNGLHYKAQSFASIYVENQGNGKFKQTKLPTEAQLSSINTILIADFTNNGKKDILAAGNLFSSESETPRNDASIGLLMTPTNDGLAIVPLNKSGFLAKKDVKDMQIITIKGKKCILVANNDDHLQVFELN